MSKRCLSGLAKSITDKINVSPFITTLAPMIQKSFLWLLRHWRWLRLRKFYVIADATDNSITLSKWLFRMMDVYNQDEAKVFVFSVNQINDIGEAFQKEYAFTLNPKLEQETQLCDIQYNQKHRCIGFETLNPTVNRIFYDYGLHTDTRCKLSVDMLQTNVGNITYYKLLRPKNNGKSA